MKVWQRGTIYLAVMKRDTSSDLAVEDINNLIIWVRVRSGPLLAGMGKFLEIKMWATAWTMDMISLRKGA